MRGLYILLPFAVTALFAAPKQLLLLGQKPDGHPPGTHEYMAGARVLKALLAHRQDLRTTIAQADEPWVEGPALIAKATK